MDIASMTELMCSWQENNGIEIFTSKSVGGGTNRKKQPPKLKFG